MGFEDFSARFKKSTQQQQGSADDTQLDVQESYRLRAKMLGVLIKDARLNASRTTQECARLMRIPVAAYEAWEFGEAAPSLPQLEVLAFYLGVPVSHFWSTNTIQERYDDMERKELEYVAVRNRMVGALLRQAREEAGMKPEEVAAACGISVAVLQQYEMGEQAVPMHLLSVLASAVRKNMTYFLDASGHIGELLAMREEWKHFTELPDELRQFAASPTNIGFIEIAVMLSKMPTDKLRNIGESMLEITL